MNDLPTSGADKPHNARAILRDYQALGDTLWSRFNGGKEGTLWYYRAIADHYIALDVGPLAEKLKRVVTRLGEAADLMRTALGALERLRLSGNLAGKLPPVA